MTYYDEYGEQVSEQDFAREKLDRRDDHDDPHATTYRRGKIAPTGRTATDPDGYYRENGRLKWEEPW